jgi:hypothetical protein
MIPMLSRTWTLALPASLLLATLSCGGNESPDTNDGGAGAGGSTGGKAGGSAAGTGGAGRGGAAAGAGGSSGAAGATAGSSGTTGGSSGAGGRPNPSGGTAGVVAGAGGGAGTAGASAGTAGSAGVAGTAGTAGAAGSGPAATCTFQIEGLPSSAIPTVGIVDWSTDLPGVTEARIEFELNDPMSGELNTGSGGVIDHTTNRALLLGLKAQRTYTYRIVVTAGGSTCTSPDQTLMTGALSGSVPTIMKDVQNPAAASKGFIIASAGITMGGGGGGGVAQVAYIFDADGDIVWVAAAPPSCSRALMNYEGTDMWMLELNVDNQGGEMRRVSMDGLDVENNVDGLSATHHDFTVLPGGIVAALSWTSTGRDPPSELVERSPNGMVRSVVRIDENLYASSTYHTNAIVYYPHDDTYTLSDRNPNLFVKIDRQGELLWQFGGNCSTAPAEKCATASWMVNHGHHLLENDHFLFFNNGQGTTGSTALEYALTETDTALTANLVWSYSANGVTSMVLGDVQRLPSGNTLVVYSNEGEIHEVDAQENLIQVFSTTSFGYANYRETLYGPPLR